YKIARNLCIDQLRQQRKQSDYNIDELPDLSWDKDLPYDDVESIRSAVSTLEPPIYAVAVKAYYWQGKSYKQIAHEHNTSVSTVASWIRRAKADLRKELA
ncbi:MAG TPA: RNA polymerase sigma factor, partial [Candidatus Saccharimonadales bacterium]|nr:RNA polymerase sigma factor [Candidatus Saccharimonadales bacterium]